MGRIRQVTKPVIPSGSTREIDARVDPTAGNPNVIRFRSGVVQSGTINVSDGHWDYVAGRLCIGVNSGLGYGWCYDYGLPVILSRPSSPGGKDLRAGIVRLITGMMKSGATSNAPNGDIGVDVVIGIPGFIPDLWQSNNTHVAGTSGWTLSLDAAVVWKFKVKFPMTDPGVWSEELALPAALQAVLNATDAPALVEFRCIDATFGAPAKMELYINSGKVLTRYWDNPAGVTTPELPPLGLNSDGTGDTPACTGYLLTMAIRNMSVGPSRMYFFDPSIIQGPNDAGTL